MIRGAVFIEEFINGGFDTRPSNLHRLTFEKWCGAKKSAMKG
jgi:hypothetical protein